MSDKESFERWWAGVEGPEYTPEVQKEINDRHGGEFRYGWLDPIQRATLLIERGAEAAGVPGAAQLAREQEADRKSTRLNSSHSQQSRMPSSA